PLAGTLPWSPSESIHEASTTVTSPTPREPSPFQEANDQLTQARAQQTLAQELADKGDARQAREIYDAILPVFRAQGQRRDEANKLHRIGLASRQIGDLQRSFDAFQQALGIWRSLDDRDGQAKTVSQLGVLYSSLGDAEAELEHYRQALAIRVAMGDRRG